MTVAHSIDFSGEPGSPAPASGRDRRVHHRREAGRVWAQVDGGWYKVLDLSLGGLRIERPVDSPGIGGVIEGEIHSRAAGLKRQSSFRATVVRVGGDDDGIGVAFAPLEAEQIDGLLAILSAMERDFVDSRHAIVRQQELQRSLRRLSYVALAAVIAVGLGYAAWFAR